MTEIDSDEAGRKSTNPFTKTYYYQNGRTFLSNTITNASLIETKYFGTNSGIDDDDDFDDDNEDDYYEGGDGSQRIGQSNHNEEVNKIEEIQESYEEEDDQEENVKVNSQSPGINEKLSASALKTSTKYTSHFGQEQRENDTSFNSKFNQNKMNQSTNDNNRSTIFENNWRSGSNTNSPNQSYSNYDQGDDLKESLSYRLPVTDNDNLISTYRTEYNNLLKDTHNISDLSQTNREIEDLSKIDTSDNQLFKKKEYEQPFNNVSFAPYEETVQNRKNLEDLENEEKTNEDFYKKTDEDNSPMSKQKNNPIPQYSLQSYKSMQSSVGLKSQFSPTKSKDDLRKVYSMRSSRSNSAGTKKSVVSLKSNDPLSRRKKMSKIFRKVLKQVKNTMFWFKKIKQQSYFKDENEREQIQLIVDGVMVKDESDEGGGGVGVGVGNSKGKVFKERYNLSDNSDMEDEQQPQQHLNSMKSMKINRRQTTTFKQSKNGGALSPVRKKKQSAGGSSQQQQSALQNENIKKKIIKSISNKKTSLSFQLIQCFWLLSLFSISFVTLFSFFFNWNNFYEYITNIQEQRLLIEIVQNSIQIISNQEYQILTNDIPPSQFPYNQLPNNINMYRYKNDSVLKLSVIQQDLQSISNRPTSSNLKQIII